METTTHTTARQIDEALADAYQRLAGAEGRIASYSKLLDDPRYGTSQHASWERTIVEAEAEADVARGEIASLEAQYTGWSRFFLVRNHGGHIHSSMSCTTCYRDTEFGWLPSVSGRTEADAVAEFGPVLCTVCYPSAPVEHTGGELREVTEARDAKAAAKTERAAAKLAKALLPDGAPLRTPAHGGSIATLAAAKSHLTDAAGWAVGGPWNQSGSEHPMFPADEVRTVAEAVAAKTGDTVEQVMAAAAKRAAKKS